MKPTPTTSLPAPSACSPDLLCLLAAELERPRELPAQVIRHLSGTHGVERDAIGAFLIEELPKLEDYEIDLALAPVFTPSLQEQSSFAELLGADSIPSSEWPELIRTLVDRPTRAHLITEDDQTHIVPLRAVSIERFVHRLRLQGTISSPILGVIAKRVPVAEQPLLKAVARRAIWELDSRREILVRFIEGAAATGVLAADAIQLLRLAETYEPVDTADLLARVPQWEVLLRHEISVASSPKPFFNERVQELHGGGRDQRGRSAVEPKQAELDFLIRLKTLLCAPAPSQVS